MSKFPLAPRARLFQHDAQSAGVCDQRAGAPYQISMNSPLITLRGAAVALAAAVTLAGPATAAPQKPAPAPAVEPAPAPEKKGFFSRTKEKLGLKRKEKEQPAAPAVQKSKAKPATSAAAKPAAKSTKPEPAVVEAKPEKKGLFKGMFKKSKDEPAAPADEPNLAKARTAKPAPVKEVKPAQTVETADGDAGPKEKRGMFGFLRRLREPVEDESSAVAGAARIERPDDWQEHKVVTQNDIALYTFGPNQFNGPDKRLDSGTVVKVKSIKRGYALVTVDGGITGYLDATALRDAAKDDFLEPAPPAMASLGAIPDSWAPLAPPPDLPDQPSKMDADAALLLLPPLEPKPNP